jgi:hypothetical protein
VTGRGCGPRAQEVVGTSDSALAAVVAADVEVMALRAEEAAILARLGDARLDGPPEAGGAAPEAGASGREEAAASAQDGGHANGDAGAAAAAADEQRAGDAGGAAAEETGAGAAAGAEAVEGAGAGGGAGAGAAAARARRRKGGAAAAAPAAGAAAAADGAEGASVAARAPNHDEDGERLNEIYTRMEVRAGAGCTGRVHTCVGYPFSCRLSRKKIARKEPSWLVA